MTVKIAIDCMGGDHGPKVTVAAALAFAAEFPQVELMLVGKATALENRLRRASPDKAVRDRLHIVNATEVVGMDEPPALALRNKKDSSMRVAINLVKSGSVDACVSAGNTGALMAVSRYLLTTLAGVDRPAICTILPNQKDGPTYVLDLGANVDCEPLHLHQFALMGSALVSAVEGHPRPTVGLLNVGAEDIKGNELVKQTAELLRADHAKGLINFYGNVAGNDIFEGTTDIVVCDGFVGNVTLKAAEGVGRLIKGVLTSELKKGWLNMLGALIATRALKRISQRLNPSRYNGAALLGLRGLVFKSHGSADEVAFEQALIRAYDAARNQLLDRVRTRIAHAAPLLAGQTQGPEAATATLT